MSVLLQLTDFKPTLAKVKIKLYNKQHVCNRNASFSAPWRRRTFGHRPTSLLPPSLLFLLRLNIAVWSKDNKHKVGFDGDEGRAGRSVRKCHRERLSHAQVGPALTERSCSGRRLHPVFCAANEELEKARVCGSIPRTGLLCSESGNSWGQIQTAEEIIPPMSFHLKKKVLITSFGLQSKSLKWWRNGKFALLLLSQCQSVSPPPLGAQH